MGSNGLLWDQLEKIRKITLFLGNFATETDDVLLLIMHPALWISQGKALGQGVGERVGSHLGRDGSRLAGQRAGAMA